MTNLPRYIVASSDWHLTKRVPMSRIDKMYSLHLEVKVHQILEHAEKINAAVAIPGDIFDSYDSPTYGMTNNLIDIFNTYDVLVYVVAGQHDMQNRMIANSCAYSTLIKSSVVTHVGDRPLNNFYGLSYGDNRKISTYGRKGDAVLLIHRTITPKTPPFFLNDAISAQSALNLYSDFKIIISGDYHVPFSAVKDDRILVNCGTIARSSKELIDFQPVFWVIDTEDVTKTHTVPLNVKPKEEVFQLAVLEGTTTVKQDAAGVSDSIKAVAELLQNGEAKPKYEDIVRALAVKNEFSKDDISILNDILRIAKGGKSK